MRLRASEWVAVVYYLYITGLSLVLPVPRTVTVALVVVNSLLFAGFALLAYADQFRRAPLLAITRDWYLVPQFLIVYRELGWLALPERQRGLEQAWVVWDKWLLNDAGLKALIELAGPLLPGVLEISYSLVYVVPPLGLVMLYIYGHRERADSYLFQVMLGIAAVYALVPYFPSEPPWTVFPGEDYPSYLTIFRRFNGGLLRRSGIHTGVFPSAHVAGSFSVALALVRLLPERRWVGRFVLVVASLIAVATVYGRYHYAVDAAAGLAVACLAWVVAVECGKRRLCIGPQG